MVGISIAAGSNPNSTRRTVGTAIAGVGVAGLLLAAPTVHGLGHQRWGAALGDLGLRLGLSVGLAFGVGAPGAAGCSGSSGGAQDTCGLGAAVVGLVAGVIGSSTAVGIDYLLLGREPASEAITARISPTLILADRGTALGLAGAF